MAKLRLTYTNWGEEDKIRYVESSHPCFFTPDNVNIDKIASLSMALGWEPSKIEYLEGDETIVLSDKTKEKLDREKSILKMKLARINDVEDKSYER